MLHCTDRHHFKIGKPSASEGIFPFFQDHLELSIPSAFPLLGSTYRRGTNEQGQITGQSCLGCHISKLPQDGSILKLCSDFLIVNVCGPYGDETLVSLGSTLELRKTNMALSLLSEI